VAPSVADDGALAVGLDGLASTAWVVGRSVEDPPAGSALVWAMLQGSPAAGVAP
jgi:hypothetical protein